MIETYFLHIDTAQNESCVFISGPAGQIIKVIDIPALKQSSLINTSIQKLMREAGIESSEIAAISVNNGPGSYTGLRVSLATAKGLALGWDRPLILHNYLDLLSYNHTGDPDFATILKAREGEYFMTIYKNGEQASGPQHYLKPDCVEILQENNIRILFTDDEQGFQDMNMECHPLDKNVRNAMTEISSLRFREKIFDDLAYSEPFYLKPAYVTTAKNNILQKKQKNI